jgi:hypothetical protein
MIADIIAKAGATFFGRFCFVTIEVAEQSLTNFHNMYLRAVIHQQPPLIEGR